MNATAVLRDAVRPAGAGRDRCTLENASDYGSLDLGAPALVAGYQSAITINDLITVVRLLAKPYRKPETARTIRIALGR